MDVVMGRPSRVEIGSQTPVPGGRLLLRNAGQIELPGGRRCALEPKDALLLAYLAIEGPTNRGRLAALAWPEADDARARGNLRQRLLRLKRAAGMELIEGNPIAALASALSHDLGGSHELLQAIETPPEGGLGDWLESQRARRRDDRAGALAAEAARAEADGNLDAALDRAVALVELEPHSEESHRRVMRLHYVRGDVAAAVAAYDRCRRTLEHDLGVAPSKETEALRETFHSAAATVPAAQSARHVPVSVLRPPRLVGRETEWAALLQAWDNAGAAVVLGEAGLGKTRLVTDFARSRPEAPMVVSARPGDERVVYALTTRLLRALPPNALETVDVSVRNELSRLLPELGDAAPIRSDAERARFCNAVGSVVEAARANGAGIVVDDLHFADSASVELLRYLWAGSPARWLFAARPAEIGPEARALVEAVRDAPGCAWIELAPLTLEQLTELVGSLGIDGLDTAAMAPALMRQSGGNPLFALEAIKSWLGRVPGSSQTRLPAAANVAALVQRRIGRLSEDAVRLARCAAVAGPDFSADVACHVLGARPLDLADAWAELESAQVFRDGGFAHDLIYEAALASVPCPIARPLHREVANFLAGHHGEPARIAEHRLAAGDEAQAIDALARAAERCIEAGRTIEAGRHYRRAAELAARSGQPPGRVFGLYHDASNALWLSASTDEFNDLIEPMGQWARSDFERSFYWIAVGHRAERDGMIEDNVRAVEQALELTVKAGDRAHEAVCRMSLGHALYKRGQHEKALHQISAAADVFRETGNPNDEAAARTSLGSILANLCRFDEANRQLELAVPWLVKGNYFAYVIANYNCRAGNALVTGHARRALELAAQARTFAASADSEAGPRAVTMQRQVEALRRLGRFREALDVFSSAREEFSGETNPDCRTVGLEMVRTFLDLGRRDRAQALLAEFEGQTNVHPIDTELAALLRVRLVDAPTATGSARAPVRLEDVRSPARYCAFAFEVASTSAPEDSGGMLEGALERARDLGINAHLAALWIALAEKRLGRDDVPGALRACDEAREALADFDSEAYRPELLLRLLRLERALRRSDRADACLKEAVNWIRRAEDVHVPAEFRESFLHRNPVNRELLALARRAG